MLTQQLATRSKVVAVPHVFLRTTPAQAELDITRFPLLVGRPRTGPTLANSFYSFHFQCQIPCVASFNSSIPRLSSHEARLNPACRPRRLPTPALSTACSSSGPPSVPPLLDPSPERKAQPPCRLFHNAPPLPHIPDRPLLPRTTSPCPLRPHPQDEPLPGR